MKTPTNRIQGPILVPTNSRPRRPHPNLPPPLPLVPRLDRRAKQQLLARHGPQARNHGASLGSSTISPAIHQSAEMPETPPLVVLPHPRPSSSPRNATSASFTQNS